MPDRFGRIGSFYDELVQRHGDDARSCDYGSADSQRRKFDVLADVADLGGARVLDVGCGLAHYADYLAARYGEVDYVGIDLSAKMIAAGRRRRPDLDLRVGNALDVEANERFDVVSANGIFYLLGDEAATLMPRLIERMWSLARQALAFNSLSTWAARREGDEFQADPFETISLCRPLSPFVTLRHDYMAHDFTIYVYREPRA